MEVTCGVLSSSEEVGIYTSLQAAKDACFKDVQFWEGDSCDPLKWKTQWKDSRYVAKRGKCCSYRIRVRNLEN